MAARNTELDVVNACEETLCIIDDVADTLQCHIPRSKRQEEKHANILAELQRQKRLYMQLKAQHVMFSDSPKAKKY
jgi:hypothetical protein